MYKQKPIYKSTHLEPLQEGSVTLLQQLELVSPDLMVPAPQLGLGLRRGRPAGWETQCTMTPGPGPTW